MTSVLYVPMLFHLDALQDTALTTVFVSLFILSFIFNIVMVIIVIWQVKSRNTKSSERKSITPDYDTTSNDKNKGTNSICVMPNEAYESHSVYFANELHQQTTLTDSTDAYCVVRSI